MSDSASGILAALPQTQCTRCGYPDCAAYARGITDEQAPINLCPPGGVAGIRRLAAITGRPELALDPEKGVELPRAIVFIDEAWCIGCTICIKACPVDAIVGASKLMHTVLESACTGCTLCIPACPVDCIVLENASGDATGWDAWSQEQADRARDRYAAARSRRHGIAAWIAPKTTVGSHRAPAAEGVVDGPVPANKQDIVAAAQARARAGQPG